MSIQYFLSSIKKYQCDKKCICVQIGRNVLLPLVQKKVMDLELIKEKPCDNFLECVSVDNYLSYLYVLSHCQAMEIFIQLHHRFLLLCAGNFDNKMRTHLAH